MAQVAVEQLMMVALGEGSTNMNPSVKEKKGKILILLEQKLYWV